MSRRVSNKKVNSKNDKENKKFINILSGIDNKFKIAGIIFAIICVSILFLFYGPWSGFRDWYITTAMTTMNHKYLAKWFYSDEMIKKVLSENNIIEIDEFTNIDEIDFNIKIEYSNEYERQILERDKNNNDYKIIKIDGKGYEGYLVAIYEPERIKTVVTKNIGKSGQFLTELAEEHDALVAINGGGFVDPNFVGTGGTPLGITISDGEFIVSEEYKGSGGIIGFTRDNKLFTGKINESQAKLYDIRDGVTFGPFLITNGKSSIVNGNGGWGTAPRTAIGQRKDGIVLFLVIDGRTLENPGASLSDLIEIMQRYGAYTAANLDGGTSTALVVDGKIVSNPINASGEKATRPISTAFILEKDEEDLGDKTIVLDKLK